MAYIGKQPTPVPLTAADFADDTITEAKMANDAISLAELKAGTDGEIISWDASGNPVAVGVGSDGQVLTSTGAGSPPAFEAAAAGGKVLQVQSALHATVAASTSGSYADTGVSDSITCAATSSKVLVIVMMNGVGKTSSNTHVSIKLAKDVGGAGYSDLDEIDGVPGYDGGSGNNYVGTSGFAYLDSPSSTSALTYKTTFASGSSSATVHVQYNSAASTITLIEIGA